jgi:hypothetical protein
MWRRDEVDEGYTLFDHITRVSSKKL